MSRDLSDDEKRIIAESGGGTAPDPRSGGAATTPEGGPRLEDAGPIGVPPWLPDFPPDCAVLVNGWWCTILGVQVGTNDHGVPTPYLVLLPEKPTRAARRRTEPKVE